MLTSLTIQNVALVDRLSIQLRPGLTVITGETGAGKSIVIDALSLALGERASTAMIRDGESKAIVEAEFDADTLYYLKPLVSESGAEWQPVLILRREVSDKGVSRCFINDSPVQVGTLKAIGDALVDIHGQHEHQSLLRSETHLGILDAYGELETDRDECARAYHSFVAAVHALTKAQETLSDIDFRKTVIEKELREINLLDPKENEDEELERQLNIAEHAERIAVASEEILRTLYDADENAAAMLGRTRKLLEELTLVDATLQPLQTEAQSALASIDEIARSIRDYMEAIEFDPERTEQMRKRHQELTGLKKKLRLSLQDILSQRILLKEELEGLASMDATVERLEREVESARAKASAAATALSKKRATVAKRLAKDVVMELAKLGMKNCAFDTRIERAPAPVTARYWLGDGGNRILASETGWDIAEFYMSANLGEEPKPLTKVVSGGEVSRIMLALKTIFANKDTVPILVFDEIDVGVSGSIARKVGDALKTLAESHQILAITHLPQIAGVGKTHLLVEKNVTGKRTITSVSTITGEDRAREIARLLSGDKITETALQNAKELILED